MERLTKRLGDGQSVMRCEDCKASWMRKHGKPMEECTAMYCRNRVKDRLAEYENTGYTPEEIEKLAADRKALKNELCQYCGKYKQAHEGACDGCRWRDM